MGKKHLAQRNAGHRTRLKLVANHPTEAGPSEDQTRPTAAQWQKVWPYVLLAVVSFGIYARTIGADFLRWDDRQNILLNPWIEHSAFKAIWTRPYYNMYIPVTYTLWTFLWHIDPQPWLFHLANVAFHVANTIIIYMVARKLLRPDERIAALFAALFFCCHPLQVETVAWISTFRDTLACFFSMWAVYIVMTRESVKAMWGATLLFCVSLLCKPSVAVIPAAFLALGYGLNFLTNRRTVTLVFWFIPALAASYVTKRVQQLDADLRLAPMGLSDRLLVAVDTLMFYIQKTLVPYPLSADYGRMREVALEENLWMIGLCILGVSALLAAIFRKRLPRRPLYFFGFFVLFLTPVLGVIPFQAQGQTTVADRYVYMPLIGLGLLFGLALGRKRLWPAGAALLSVLAVMTVSRAEVWHGNERFFRDMLEKNERSHVALSSLGVEFILTGRLAEAQDVLNRAIQLRPMDVIPRTNMAQLYLLQNRPDRVMSEIVPLLNDRQFLHVNQTETRALASAYRLAARAHWSLSLWSGANEFFCRWFRLDWENEEGKAEIMRFLQDAQKHGVKLANCESPAPK